MNLDDLLFSIPGEDSATLSYLYLRADVSLDLSHQQKKLQTYRQFLGSPKIFPSINFGTGKKTTSSQKFPTEEKGGGTNFSKKFHMKTNDFLFALLRFQAWKALNEASESGDSVLQGMTQVLWRGSAEVLEQTDLPKSLRSLKLGRNYIKPKTPKSHVWHTKIERMDKKDSKLKCWGGCCWMIWEAFGQITTKKRPPKRWLWWFRFAVSIGD